MNTIERFQEGKEFWDNLNNGELHIQKCKTCQHYVFYPRTVCPIDLGELEYTKISGKGTVLTYSKVVNSADPRIQNLPILVGVVRLAEGPTIYAQLISNEGDSNLFNKQVECVIDQFGELKIPKFKVI